MQMVGERTTWWREALNWGAGGSAHEWLGLGQITAFIHASLPLSANRKEDYYFSLRPIA